MKSEEISKREAMRYVIEHPSGYIKTLRNVIGTEHLSEFNYLGYIKKRHIKYQSTATLKEDYDAFYSKPTIWMIIKSILFGFMTKIFRR